MTATTHSYEPSSKLSIKNSIIAVAVLLVLSWAWRGAEMAPMTFLEHPENMVQLLNDFFPADFSESNIYLQEMLVTIQVGIWGTVLSVLFAIPFGILSAENLMPSWVSFPVRRLMDCLRAINEMVFAMLFVVVVGLGPFAGVMALFVHTTGVLAKLFAEAIEAIEPGPVEGVKATGANSLEVILYGVIPQVMPLWISYSLYRLESNIRSATVVGMVGAGGIGVLLWQSISGFQLQQTAAIMAIVIVTVSIIDFVSQIIRKKFI
ncbi:phosphonate ABC transporter, permease protein PhnE [Vibrio sp. RE88]|uniref:phosphonate ABC transporter, permease protein PhnE n=1 Tax=Vibrio sp. RE88 TaxID=2607610 RepID=UPI001493D4E7|nr:phosphonate ABC transporter, permease protein PhnE [Vibrio sp. RE88]NOH62229.1 phosphonate ABC transporter, permease protein PhnE [Vibrio sp. RE88]